MKDYSLYSGDKSEQFWRRVNRLDDVDRGAIYSLGVALQNLEEYVLNQLRNAEVSMKNRHDKAGNDKQRA